ncbi:MAG: NACHT domain-containing protein [Dactylosporangium sp.]|nr:NACHT domain-containing protein [Dactylosporangium sp.]
MKWWRSLSRLQHTGISLIAGGLAILAILLPLLGLFASDADLDRMGDYADILAFSSGALGGILVLIDRISAARQLSQHDLDKATERLVRQVRDRESQQRTRLLGTDRATISAANLRYHQPEGLVRFRESDSSRTGTLEGIGRYYADGVRDHRLVILGGPGAGKTVLALELMMQLLDQPAAETASAWATTARAVPVRLSLSTWDVHRPLATWLAHEVAAQFGVSAVLAQALVDKHRILPILDGLDEMDPPTSAPERSLSAVTQLNAYLDGRLGAPLVVTCRTDHYQRLRDAAGTVLRPGTEITIRPLDSNQIRDYLDREYDSSVDWSRRRQWTGVLDRLEDPEDPRLLIALGTPWRLTLAVTYHRAGGDPDDLLPSPAEYLPVRPICPGDEDRYLRRIEDLLLSSFIPARARMHEPHRYSPTEVVEWCRGIAEHLGRRCDIVLHEWWSVGDAARVRRWHAAAAGAIAVALVLVVEAVAVVSGSGDEIVAQTIGLLDRPRQPSDYATAVWTLLFVVGFPGLAVRQARRARVVPTRTNPQQLRTSLGRRRFLRWLGAGLLVGATPGLMFALTYTFRGHATEAIAFMLSFGLAFGLMFALTGGLRPIGEGTVDPADPLRNDLVVWLAVGLAVSLGYGLPSGLMFPASPGPGTLAEQWAMGLAGGLLIPFALGLVGHAWLRYAIAVGLLASQRRLPLRFIRFLRWAHQAGIVRIAGNAYQFRHAELRDWLREPSPRPVQAISTLTK